MRNERPPHYIKEWRKHKGLTQERFALRIGKTQSWVSQIERFEIEYTQGALEAIANAIGCDPGDLLTVNPLKAGEVVDIASLLRGAPPFVQKQAYAVIETLLQTGTSGPTGFYQPEDDFDERSQDVGRSSKKEQRHIVNKSR